MISWDRVEELRSEVGPEDFEEVVEMFLEEVEEVIERLRVSPDPSTYEADLHFLKGSALNLGFAAFGDLCQIGERNAAQGNLALIDPVAVIQCFEASKADYGGGAARLGSAA